MKRGLILSAVFLTLSLSCVFALSSNLKESYAPGETIIIEVRGDISGEVEKNNVELRRGHVPIPFEFDFKKLGEHYYLWGIAPQEKHNYSLVIQEIQTRMGGNLESVDFVQNFSVQGNVTEYTLKPGFLLGEGEFFVDVYLNADDEQTIQVDFPSERNILLKPGKNTVAFSVENTMKGLQKIRIGAYTLYANFPQEISANRSIEEDLPALRIEPQAIVSTILADERPMYPFKIVNYGRTRTENISVEWNQDLLSLSPSPPFTLDADSELNVNVSFARALSAEIQKAGVQEKIIVKAKGTVMELPLVIRFTDNENETKTPYLEGEVSYYCSELKGIICSAEEQCEGKTETSIDGACCIGKCSVPPKKWNSSWIGYVLGLAVLIILVVIYKKYRRTKGENPLGKRVAAAERKIAGP